MKALLVTLTVLIAITSNGQTKRFIETYKKETGLFKTLTVPMTFDSDSITRPKFGAKIEQVYRVDYVASSFQNSLTDYQKRLDRQRWTEFYKYSGITPSAEFETNIYYQTSAKNEEEAKLLFHGFIVYYNLSAEKLHSIGTGTTGSLMKSITGAEVTKKTTAITITKPIALDTVFLGTINAAKKKEVDQLYTKNNTIVEWDYDSVENKNIFYNARYFLTKVSAGVFIAYNALADKSLLEMFRRIDMSKNTLIVTDMTGSMSPYYTQLLMWHTLRMNEKKYENYVFFNDGDAKPQSEKLIGSTGGIYSSRTNNLLSVYQLMNVCMANGGGGDCPENNMEAVLHGISQFENIERIILICDNFAVPRDKSLLPQIKTPIDFVICGTGLGVNKEYLNMARLNKGRIHTIEKSLDDLGTKEINSKFSIGARNYTVSKNGITDAK